MFGWDEAEQSHQQVYRDNDPNEKHEGKFSHELLAGGAAFEGFKLYEDQQRKEGKTVNHAFAKEALMGLVGGEVDRLVETKGLDKVDAMRTRERAEKGSAQMYDEHYGGQDNYDPNGYGAPQQIQNYGGRY